MANHRGLPLLLAALFLLSCSTSKRMKYNVSPTGEVKAQTSTMEFLEQLLTEDEQLKGFLARKDELGIQVIYTRIDRDKNNRPSFEDFYFNVNPARYFYPASTVKMPTALLALEKLERLGVPGMGPETTMITGKAYGKQTEVLTDPTTPDGRPTVGHYARKIFLVSDNDAQNRLYEFLGQKYLNETLRIKGYAEAEIIHRLDISLPEDENRRTNPVSFLDRSGKKLFDQPIQTSDLVFFDRHDSVGKGYMRRGEMVPSPMDFSRKNRISLPSLHQILKSIMFPGAVPGHQSFRVSDSVLNEVRKWMSMYPTESAFPAYHAPDYYPAYCKFLLYGAERNAELIPGVRIFNKVGDAYGFLLDIAYVADFEHKVEFMCSAVIYCNADGILNDDKYDYDSIGFPFLKRLGQHLYQHELKRKREFVPDLTEFRFRY